jgi:hypothetical protein
MATTTDRALHVLARTGNTVLNFRQRVMVSKENALKQHYERLVEDFEELRTVVVDLVTENAELRRVRSASQTPKPVIRHVGRVNYYFVADDGPYCQRCFDQERELHLLTAQQRYAGGTGRNCQRCKTVFIEAAS